MSHQSGMPAGASPLRATISSGLFLQVETAFGKDSFLSEIPGLLVIYEV